MARDADNLPQPSIWKMVFWTKLLHCQRLSVNKLDRLVLFVSYRPGSRRANKLPGSCKQADDVSMKIINKISICNVTILGQVQFFIFSSKQHVRKTKKFHVKIGASYIKDLASIRNTGLVPDRRIGTEKQVNSICKSCCCQIRWMVDTRGHAWRWSKLWLFLN